MSDDTAYIRDLIANGKRLPDSTAYFVKPSPAGALRIDGKHPLLGPGSGKARINVVPGCGTGRLFEVTSGKARLEGFEIQGPSQYVAGDDVSAVGLDGVPGAGLYAKDVRFGRLHVAARTYRDVKQSLCFDHCINDHEKLGLVAPSVFGVLAEHFGDVTINGGEWINGGSLAYPNQCHQIYIGFGVALAITGTKFGGHVSGGRYVQVYDGDRDPMTVPAPAHWTIHDASFGKMADVKGGYRIAIQTNPRRKALIDQVSIESGAYSSGDFSRPMGIEVRGDVDLRNSSFAGAGEGLSYVKQGAKVTLTNSPSFQKWLR